MKRYHPALVALHWLLAILIILALAMGKVVLAHTPNADPAKLGDLQGHMIIGISILALMTLRLAIRLMTKKPPAADIGNAMLNKGAGLAHMLLYALVIAMGVSGLATSNAAGLPDIVFFGSGTPLPENFNDIAAHTLHWALSIVLILLIVGHILAALIHQFVRKDSLFARMWFGKR
jgi:cytochrome b561